MSFIQWTVTYWTAWRFLQLIQCGFDSFNYGIQFSYLKVVYDERTGEDTEDLMNIEDTIKAVKKITGKEYKKEDFETETAFNKIKDKLEGDNKKTWLFVRKLETWNTL